MDYCVRYRYINFFFFFLYKMAPVAYHLQLKAKIHHFLYVFDYSPTEISIRINSLDVVTDTD